MSEMNIESNKAETRKLMNKLTNMRYNGIGGVMTYIMKLESNASKPRNIEISIPNDFIVH